MDREYCYRSYLVSKDELREQLREHSIAHEGSAHDVIEINYELVHTPLEDMLVAASSYGIVAAFFIEHNLQDTLKYLQKRFPRATLKSKQGLWRHGQPVSLDFRGTPFERSIWRLLLQVRRGALCSYGHLAQEIKNEKASRAVGRAVGRNPIAYLVPCHRVVRSDGGLGGYAYGLERKRKLLEQELCLEKGSLEC